MHSHTVNNTHVQMIAGIEVYSQKYLPVLWNVLTADWVNVFAMKTRKSDRRSIPTSQPHQFTTCSHTCSVVDAVDWQETWNDTNTIITARQISATRPRPVRFCLRRRQNLIIIRANLLMFRIWLRRALLSCLRTQSRCTCHRLRCHYTALMTTPSTTTQTQTRSCSSQCLYTVTPRHGKVRPSQHSASPCHSSVTSWYGTHLPFMLLSRQSDYDQRQTTSLP